MSPTSNKLWFCPPRAGCLITRGRKSPLPRPASAAPVIGPYDFQLVAHTACFIYAAGAFKTGSFTLASKPIPGVYNVGLTMNLAASGAPCWNQGAPHCDRSVPDEKHIYAILVDRSGQVLWRAEGDFDEAKALSLQEVLKPGNR